MKMKVVKVENFDRAKFEEWCERENKVNNDLAIVEYCAKVLNAKNAKECWDLLQEEKINIDDVKVCEGIDMDNIEVIENSKKEHKKPLEKKLEKITDEQVKGWKQMMSGIMAMFDFEKETKDMIFDEIKEIEAFDENTIKVYVNATLDAYKDKLVEILDVNAQTVLMGSLLTKIAKK